MNTAANSKNTVIRWINCFIAICEKIPESLAAFALRLGVAMVFWKSAHTKISGISIIDAGWFPPFVLPTGLDPKAFTLFEYEYIPNCAILGFLPINAVTYLGSAAEYFLPLMLVFGFGTRFAAIGLLGVSLVIQCVYPDAWWSHHAFWAGALLYLASRGAGTFSLDHLVRKNWT